MAKQRLDQLLVTRGLVPTRSQAESWIRMGKVFVRGQVARKPGLFVTEDADIELKTSEQYVSRAGLKLASVAQALHLNFQGAAVLDVGSSTGGFTDYALQHGARKVIAVDVGTDQLHPSLHGNPKIELHEQTDIRNVVLAGGSLAAISFSELRRSTADSTSSLTRGVLPVSSTNVLAKAARAGDPPKVATPQFVVISETPDIVVIDVSFISLREILPHVARLSGGQTKVAAMLKPQFEAGHDAKHKGVIKNDAMRRDILKNFETWVKKYFVILDKADSQVSGTKGNRERFYLLQKIAKG
ncbi:MAG TPA: TlyA family RNA methyltransferase [Candidatus Saccharimonadales bacterium]|nr:TlyA family RNA methyltransferase [Candidatus Saccharimonadales bacterium]